MALLNFLYRDWDLANSLYAQIYNGLLQTIEDGSKTGDSQSATGKMSCAVAGGSLEGKTTTETSRIEKISPHDIIFIDVLKHIEKYYKTDVTNIQTGDIAFVAGKLYVLEKEMVRASFETFGLNALRENPELKKNKALLNMIIPSVRKALEYSKDDSMYVLVQDDGAKITGTIKDKYMSDSIASMVMKFGPFPVAPVYVVGVVEDGPANPASAAINPFPNGNMTQVAVEAARMIFSFAGRQVGSTSVKPLAIFCKINTE